MTSQLENDSSRDFLDAVLGLRSQLQRVWIASEGAEADSLRKDDPAVLLLLGLRSLQRNLDHWIQSLEDPTTEPGAKRAPEKSERLMR